MTRTSFESDAGPTTLPARPTIACRRFHARDIDEAVEVLARGFPERSQMYWRRGLERLRNRPVHQTMPQFGFVLTDAGRIVGIVCLISSSEAGQPIFANVSSWYVEPAYRGFANVLLAYVFRLENIVLFNVSPMPRTVETITAQGFRLYCNGTFHALPLVAPPVLGARLRRIAADESPSAGKLGRLAAYGCRCYEIEADGRVHRFAFLARRFARDRMRCAQLVYCDDIASFVRFAGPLGRRLARHGLLSVMIDANGPIDGLHGRFLAGRRPKYYRGSQPPPQNDLSDTELVLFGP